MAYEFKKLSAAEAVTTVSDTASVLIEEDGVIKRAPKGEIGGGIKVASAAEVGQTIVVKAVDEDGNPTEWECANMGSNIYTVISYDGEIVFASEGIYDAINNNTSVILMLYYQSASGSYSPTLYTVNTFSKNDSGSFEGWVGNSVYHYFIHSDNSVQFYYDD